MVRIRPVKTPLAKTEADAVAVGLFQEVAVAKQPVAPLDRALDGLLTDLVKMGDLRGKSKETRVLPTRGRLQSPRLIVIGLGKPKDYTVDLFRETCARSAWVARDQRLTRVAIPLWPPKGTSANDAAQALAEGVVLGLFEFREYKSEPGKDEDPRVALDEVLVAEPLASRTAAIRDGLATGVKVAEATNLARTLIMRPSLAKAPDDVARVARAEASKRRIRCTVLGVPELRRLGMGALLGVGSGSSRPPRLVVLEYRGKGPRVLLCGKGIVFDSGGINIKPSEGMDRMKYDMAGSATVLGAVLAAADLRLPVHAMAIMAMAENMPSGSAIRPGDVLRAYNGKTIEVANTDAEGRLVLADALSYGVARHKPDAVVDVATLTGAVRVALGNITTGILGNNEKLIQRLIAAGRRTGDDLWQLPLTPAYERQVNSEIADVKNTGAAGSAGTIAGAAFLKRFVADSAWVHLDIAGTCWSEKGPAELNKDYMPKGPTGIGVRLLVEWMKSL